jgi:predicted nucleotidyltransferase
VRDGQSVLAMVSALDSGGVRRLEMRRESTITLLPPSGCSFTATQLDSLTAAGSNVCRDLARPRREHAALHAELVAAAVPIPMVDHRRELCRRDRRLRTASRSCGRAGPRWTQIPNLGILIPNLGIKVRQPARAPRAQSMVDALFPRTKQRVLALLFGQPERSFSTTEVIGLAESGSGAVQRELDRLVASGLVTATRTGRQRLFRANRDAAIFEELRGIVDKSAGVVETVRNALAPLTPRIRFAALYGSVAKARDRATSDVDVLVVADDVTLEAIYAAFEPAEARLGRRVSPTLYTTDESRRRRAAGQAFLTKVLGGAHVVLMGSADAAESAR